MGTPTSSYLAQKEILSTRNASEILSSSGRTVTGRERNLHFIEIDNNKIGGYGTYSFYIQKTYAKEPSRSTAGTIDNLDSYSTFLTPTVKIKFNAMSIEQYRKVIKLMHEKNEHLVKCYDVVYDTIRTFNAYFAPDDYPELFVLDFELISVLNYEIELIGTNTSLDKCSITYHPNDPSGTLTNPVGSPDYNMGQEIIMGSSAGDIKTLSGYTFDRWNTKPDGTGEWYIDNTAYIITSDLVLYAQWNGGDIYTISYNYGVAPIAKDENGEEIISKTIKYGEPITFQNTEVESVTFLNNTYYPYSHNGWYWLPQPVENSNQIISGETVYSVKGNSTIYQNITTATYKVMCDYSTTNNMENINSRLTYIIAKYGEQIELPEHPVEGNNAWLLYRVGNTVLDEMVTFDQTTMPPVDVYIVSTKIEND